jgi:hypothetical protein
MKNNCYIFWDVEGTEKDRVYIQCEECFEKNKYGIPWDIRLLKGLKELKCDLCPTIIYKRKKRKKE